MRKSQKLLLSTVVVGVLGSVVALGVFGLFSATTQNSGNEISSGTVVLGDNDAGSSLFNITGAKPGDNWTRCIKVTYNGSLPAQVHLYLQNTTGPLANYLNLTMTQGSQASPTFPNCNGFTPDATGVIFSGPIYSPASGNWEMGLPVTPAGSAAWKTGDSLAFKFSITLDPATPDTLQNASLGTSTIVWEARNE
jgi:camelysin-like metallo-endopeptidase